MKNSRVSSTRSLRRLRSGRRLRWFAITSAGVLLLVSCVAPKKETEQPVSMTPAVLGLAEDARQSKQHKQYARAVAQLERALRIEPSNPSLWHELADANLAQGLTEQAIQFALKSNALTRDGALRSRNWRLIAEAHMLQGDRDLAREAREKADSE